MRNDPIPFKRWLLGLVLLLCFVQRTIAQPTVEPPVKPAHAASPSPAGSSSPASSDAVEGASQGGTRSQYVIGPGDTLHIFVWQNPDLSVTLPVRPDGKISTPLVEDLVAVGKTPAQLARDMEAVLSEYVRSPKVNVIVSGALSTFSQVKVIGQVKTPTSAPYREGMTVLDLILQAGGLTDFAAGNRAKLIRKDPSGKDSEQNIRLDDLVRKGKLSENVSLLPGDVLIVPESRF